VSGLISRLAALIEGFEQIEILFDVTAEKNFSLRGFATH
jgi:hypothetical protein